MLIVMAYLAGSHPVPLWEKEEREGKRWMCGRKRVLTTLTYYTSLQIAKSWTPLFFVIHRKGDLGWLYTTTHAKLEA